MIRLTDEMRTLVDGALANGTPCLLATVSPSGAPNLGFKGSVMVFDDKRLAYWERTRGGHLANLEQNPQVVVLYADLGKGVVWTFRGVAALHRDGPLRDQVMARVVQPELDRDPGRKGVAVLIQVDRVLNIARQVVQQRD